MLTTNYPNSREPRRPVFMRVTRPTLCNALRNMIALALIALSIRVDDNAVGNAGRVGPPIKANRVAVWLMRLAWKVAP